MIRKVFIAGTICFLLTLLPIGSQSADNAANVNNNADTYKLLKLFGDVFEIVRSEYVEPVSDDDLIDFALNGMLTSLDPHSSYMSKKSFQEFQTEISGEFGGLGVQVTMDGGWVRVISPIDDTPAHKAGIKTNDLITHLNGESVQGLSLGEAVDRMRGPVNSTIKLSIKREGVPPFDVTLSRAIIKNQTVKAKVIHDVGYIRISQFIATTTSGLTKAIEQVKKEGGKELQGVVLDLRNNPGGLIDQAVAVTSNFIEKGEVVSTRSRKPEDTHRSEARGKDQFDGLPLVVLINEGSASASEIVAGALQDHHRAVLLGTKSFGKGSVQSVIPLPGHGGIRLTVARYYTPSGRSIQQVGIEPDIKVIQSKVVSNNVPEHQRSEASLRGALRNDTIQQEKPASGGKQIANPEHASKDGKVSEAKANDGEENSRNSNPDVENDYQLSRAIDLIHGLYIYHPSERAR